MTKRVPVGGHMTHYLYFVAVGDHVTRFPIEC